MLAEDRVLTGNISRELGHRRHAARRVEVGPQTVRSVDHEAHGDIRVLGDARGPVDVGHEDANLVALVDPHLARNVAITKGLDVDFLDPVFQSLDNLAQLIDEAYLRRDKNDLV